MSGSSIGGYPVTPEFVAELVAAYKAVGKNQIAQLTLEEIHAAWEKAQENKS
jgi:hypothetical protein